MAHLEGTAVLLSRWGVRDQDTLSAGLLHSVYGTSYFEPELLSHARDRGRLSREIGARAERLAFLFCAMSRPQFCGALAESRGPQVTSFSLTSSFSSSSSLASSCGLAPAEQPCEPASQAVTISAGESRFGGTLEIEHDDAVSLLAVLWANSVEQLLANQPSMLGRPFRLPPVWGAPCLEAARRLLPGAAADEISSLYRAPTPGDVWDLFAEAEDLYKQRQWAAAIRAFGGLVMALRAEARAKQADGQPQAPPEVYGSPQSHVYKPPSLLWRAHWRIEQAFEEMDLLESPEARAAVREAVADGAYPSWRQRSGHHVKGLLSKPFHDPALFPFLEPLRLRWQAIRRELVAVVERHRALRGREEPFPLKSHSKDFPDMSQLQLWFNGFRNEWAAELAPETMSMVDGIVEATSMVRGNIKFSILRPHGRVRPHTGPTNARLRAHLGLVVPPGCCGLLVPEEEVREWREGEWLVVDDSFEHTVWNNSSDWRGILILDFWHPDAKPDDLFVYDPFLRGPRDRAAYNAITREGLFPTYRSESFEDWVTAQKRKAASEGLHEPDWRAHFKPRPSQHWHRHGHHPPPP